MNDDSELTFGGLDWRSGDPFLALEGGGTGTPRPIATAMARLLLDGEIVTFERDGNRDMQWLIEVTGDDVLALNEAEALLVAEVRKPRNQLRWKPAGVNTPVSVFDTFAGSVEQLLDVEGDPTTRRVYSVTIPALPHARSETLKSASLVGGTAPTLLEACDATTNFGTLAGTPAPTVDTAVKVAGTGSLKVSTSQTINSDGTATTPPLAWYRTASFAAAAGAFVVLAIRGDYITSGAPVLTYTLSGGAAGQATTLTSSLALGNGWIEHTFSLNNTSTVTVGSMTVHAPAVSDKSYTPGTYTRSAWLDNIRTFTGQIPNALQALRRLATGGSVRTPGTLRLSNASTALGSVLVHTCEDLGDGYRPDLARWYTTSGTRASDSSSVSGYTFTTGARFEVPNGSLAPGPYAVFVRGSASAAPPSVTLSAQTVIGSSTVGSSVDATGNVPASLIAPLGVIHLPASATPGQSSGVTRFTLTVNGVGKKVDELWVFRLDGQLTWLDALTTKRVFIESPTPDLPYGAVWVGDNADQSDARHPGSALRMLGRHIFASPVAQVFVAATDAAPSMDLLHYETWHSNAAS